MRGDLFSRQSDFYNRYRPDYPKELFDLVLKDVKDFGCAWDCATGNGQVAAVLCERFDTVKASDISEAQLVKAVPRKNISYSISSSERTEYPDGSFSLITVGQALHWFDFDPFFEELKRVSAEGAVFSAWTYTISTIDPDIDAIIDDFYSNILSNYWAKERSHIECKYESIPLPFANIQHHELFQIKKWSVEHYLGFLRSWSAVQKYIDERGKNPIDIIEFDLKMKWGNGLREVKFPLYLKIAIVN